VRLFVAFDIPEEIRQGYASLIHEGKKIDSRARWVHAEAVHITLKFLGETPADRVEAIAAALGKLKSSRPVELKFRGVGFFPNERRPRVMWAGIEASPNLSEIAQAADESLAAIGFERETRPFVPHLTLARFPIGGSWDRLIQAAAGFSAREFGPAVESEFYLFQSFLKPSGAEYKKLATFPFLKETT